ncbi:MAG: FAD-dependent oxidoreductase [Rhodocyclaceae bacterium]|nr:FAD-dependent oxidoreductase [Rhodocyclaceae bacterium]
MSLDRRDALKAGAALALSSLLPACATPLRTPPTGRVVVVGAGWGGATTARYLRRWAPSVEVTVVEPARAFVSCPQSNLVLSGGRNLASLTLDYGRWAADNGIRLVRDTVRDIDPERRRVQLAGGGQLEYDRLVLSPGVDFDYAAVPGLEGEAAQARVPHAWKAGPQTAALRARLEAMPDGGVFVMTIPAAPYRCPPGPYERASLVATYLARHKPRAKLIVLDANPDIISKKGLFRAAWRELYPTLIEYRPSNAVLQVDTDRLTVRSEFEDLRADVLNVIPPQRAGDIARRAGALGEGERWARVNFIDYRAERVDGIHVIGDATLSTPAPKSGHVANQQGKVLAAALADHFAGRDPYRDPVLSNTCYSFVSNDEAFNVAAVYRVAEGGKGLRLADGSSGVSQARSSEEAALARAWATNIWSDMLG